jgi:hypothetical protein
MTAHVDRLTRFTFVLALLLMGCKSEQHKVTRIYFGFVKHNETRDDVLRLANQWGYPPICPLWRATTNREHADYQVLFGTSDVTLIDRRGRVLYSGGLGPLFQPHGNPNGGGVNLCKLMGE